MDRWPEVATNVAEVLIVSGGVWFDLASAAGQDPEHCPLCGARTKREPKALEAGGIIDAEVVSDEGEDVQHSELLDDERGA